MYSQGVDIPKDMVEAARWFTKAAQQGHGKAQMDLGTMYSYGLVYDKDVSTGLGWLIKSSKQPDSRQVALERIHKICSFQINALCAGYATLP
jgi:uncharacterized protein